MMPTNPSIIYKSEKGRDYRVVTIAKVKDSDKWVNKVLKYKWQILIKFLDNNSKAVLFFDHNDKLNKLKNWGERNYDEVSENLRIMVNAALNKYKGMLTLKYKNSSYGNDKNVATKHELKLMINNLK